MTKTLQIIAILIFSSAICFAQNKNDLFFGKGARICFVGNSITHNGEFYHNILLYHVTRFPEQPVSFYNCGISGDVTSGVLNRIEDDILVHQPTHAVVMLGMNDVDRSLYRSKPTTNADTLRYREEAIHQGINLAEYTNTPQYIQAMKVREMLSELWKMEDALRRIKFIEYDPFFKESPFKDNLPLLGTHLDSVFTVRYRSPYYNNELKEYISDKPRQDEYRMASDDIRQKVYKLACPKGHLYRVTAQK